MCFSFLKAAKNLFAGPDARNNFQRCVDTPQRNQAADWQIKVL